MSHSRFRRSFTLVEVLFFLSLAGTAMVIEARLFHSSMRIITAAPLSQDQLLGVDQMTAALRRDVWGASGIEIPDAKTIALTRAGNTAIRWTLGDSQAIRNDGAEQRWPLPVAFQAQREGPALVLRPATENSNFSGEIRLTSQMLFAIGGGR